MIILYRFERDWMQTAFLQDVASALKALPSVTSSVCVVLMVCAYRPPNAGSYAVGSRQNCPPRRYGVGMCGLGTSSATAPFVVGRSTCSQSSANIPANVTCCGPRGRCARLTCSLSWHAPTEERRLTLPVEKGIPQTFRAEPKTCAEFPFCFAGHFWQRHQADGFRQRGCQGEVSSECA